MVLNYHKYTTFFFFQTFSFKKMHLFIKKRDFKLTFTTICSKHTKNIHKKRGERILLFLRIKTFYYASSNLYDAQSLIGISVSLMVQNAWIKADAKRALVSNGML